MKVLVIDSQKTAKLLIKRKLIQKFHDDITIVSSVEEASELPSIGDFNAIILGSTIYTSSLKNVVNELKDIGYNGTIILSIVGAERNVVTRTDNIRVVDKTLNDEDFLQQIMQILNSKGVDTANVSTGN